jgi:glycosyltransferase involved in cell wall biosynthesis
VLQAVSSKYMQAAFQARYGRRPLYLPYATYMQTKAETPSPFTERTAVYMGNLYAEYDHDLIFKAAELLKARGLSPRIEIMGSGPEIEQWRTYVSDRGLGNINVAGFVSGDDLWARLRHAHVLLFPIRPTPGNLSRCPSKTYSYAQARRPIIACRVSEVPEVLGETAQYVEPTAEAFADALAAAMQRPQPDVDYGVERHNWDVRANALLAELKASEGNS